MHILHNIAELQAWRQTLNSDLALVPTMGNLHAGHLSLVAQAQNLAAATMVSIFVNPKQFAPHEDFNTYPRTLSADLEKLAAKKVDAVFIPQLAEIYPQALGTDASQSTTIIHPELGQILCGKTRPQFFGGVLTIVNILFNLIRPQHAIFGEKDYQQLLLIKTMVRDLHLPVKIHGAPIVREADGLAQSSRNQYLSSGERAQACQLYHSLVELRQQIWAGNLEFDKLCAAAAAQLNAQGFKVDYLTVRNLNDLSLPTNLAEPVIILAAAYLGQTRLLDNLIIQGNCS